MNSGRPKASFLTWAKGIDVYGSGAQINFRGQKTYKTGIGAFVSIISVLFIMSYAAIRMERWVNKRDNDVVSNTILKEMSGELFLNAPENRFQFAYAWMNL